MVLPHFKDEFVCPFWHMENRIRKTNFIIIVSLCFIGQVGGGQKLCQHIFVVVLPFDPVTAKHPLLSFEDRLQPMFEMRSKHLPPKYKGGLQSLSLKKWLLLHFQSGLDEIMTITRSL